MENNVRGKAKLIKKLYGVTNERGGTSWVDELPEYLKTSSHSPDHALITRYKESRSGPRLKKALNLTTISVQSPFLKHVVRDVFRNYPGESVDDEEPTFEAPFHSFFHQWATLNSAYDKWKYETKEQREEFAALLGVVGEEFDEAIRDAQNLVRNGNISFPLLWALFPPGCPVLGSWKNKEHCFLVNEAKYLMAEVVPTFALELILLDHDGDRYGWRKISQFVPAFGGSTKITALPAVPIQFHENSTKHLEALHDRGSITSSLIQDSPTYKAYKGPVRLHRAMDMEEVVVFIEGRAIMDPRLHAQNANRYCPSVNTIPHKLEYLLSRDPHTKMVTHAENDKHVNGLLSVAENLNQHPILSLGRMKLKTIRQNYAPDNSPLQQHRWTEHLLGIRSETFCRSVIRGYCLTSKAWAEFEVENIADIQWNRDAFDSLVISPARKRLLEALVKQQQTHKTHADFDDIVQGKGQGLIMLLAGPPGTGKTLTAESIADRLQLPLYAVSANQLGDTAEEIEDHFGQVLRLAAAWDAVLLLDEADAFLEKRVDTPEARGRNKRVAAFLRILEYYKGILILTTNRAVNFDDAFYSRIHLTLSFKPLDQESRKDIWKIFLRDADVSSADLSHFASEELNGRQIKNIMKMARLLAKNDDAALSAEHIRDVLMVAREDLQPLHTS